MADPLQIPTTQSPTGQTTLLPARDSLSDLAGETQEFLDTVPVTEGPAPRPDNPRPDNPPPADPPPADPTPGQPAPAQIDVPLPPTHIDGVKATDDLPSFADRFAAAWRQRTIETDVGNYAGRLEDRVANGLFNELPAEAQDRLRALGFDPQANRLATDAVRARLRTRLFDEARAAGLEAVPTDEAMFQDMITARRRAEWEEVSATLDVDGQGAGGFLGGLARDIVDPINLAFAPFGVTGGVARTFIAESALGGVAAGLGLPREFAVADELDLPRPDALTRVATEVLASGVLGAGAVALLRGAQAVKTRRRARREGLLPDVPRIEQEEALAEAEARLRAEVPERDIETTPDSTPTETQPGAPDPAGADLGLPPGAPPDWPQIRNGIFAGESNGDFDALFSFQNRPGGRFANIKLTEMTVEEAIEFSRPDGEYGQWVKGQIGRVATPMGAFQVVGTTLRAAAKALHLNGDELMTPELQDRIGLWIFRTQGTKAWVGYRGPQSSQPRPGGTSAPFVPTTTRAGFTSAGQVRTAAGTRIDVQYEVVDASLLTRASGDLQPRDRSLGNSDEQISNMAATLDPALLMPSPTADRGAPIVGPDNVIESGNGRFAAITRASQLHPDRIDAYRQQIEAAGFEIPEGVSEPVLIARRTSALDNDARRSFVIEAQDSGIARMTPVERSRAEASVLDPGTLSRLDPTRPLDDAANGDFLRAALDRLPRSERNAFVTPEGRLNADGRAALERALFARAFNDPDLVRRFTEGDAGELRALLDALFEASPAWARLVADVTDGAVRPEFDITGHVIEAMRLIGQARRLAQAENLRLGDVLSEMLDETDLIEGAVSPLTRALVGKLWKNGRAEPKDKIADFLTRYANEARKVGRTDAGLFDGPDVGDVLRRIDPESFADLSEIGSARFQNGPSDQPPPRVDDVIPEDAFSDGALSREAIEADEIAEADLRAAVSEAAADATDLREIAQRMVEWRARKQAARPDDTAQLRQLDREQVQNFSDLKAAMGGNSDGSAGRLASALEEGASADEAFADLANSAGPSADQNLTDALDFLSAARVQGDDLLADGDFEVLLDNGETISARDLLDDINDDMALDTVIATCTARAGR